MLALLKPCEPPSHSVFHLISGVLTIAAVFAAAVIFVHWVV